MKDIGLPNFDTLDTFIDLSDMVKFHAEKDLICIEELTKMTNARPGQVQRFTEPPIRAQTMLQELNSSLLKYWVHAMDMRGIFSAPMEKYRFPWAQTCEELFINCTEYEKSHPFQEISRVDC